MIAFNNLDLCVLYLVAITGIQSYDNYNNVVIKSLYSYCTFQVGCQENREKPA